MYTIWKPKTPKIHLWGHVSLESNWGYAGLTLQYSSRWFSDKGTPTPQVQDASACHLLIFTSNAITLHLSINSEVDTSKDTVGAWGQRFWTVWTIKAVLISVFNEMVQNALAGLEIETKSKGWVILNWYEEPGFEPLTLIVESKRSQVQDVNLRTLTLAPKQNRA